MPASPAFDEFCLGQSGAFLVPAEALSARGVCAEVAQSLVSAERLSCVQLDRLTRGVALYWQRCATLHERAPAWWFAPRPVNLLVVSDARQVPPYIVPFPGASAVLYLSDLGPSGAAIDAPPAADPLVEWVAYLLLHNERLALVGSLRGSHLANLSYWLTVGMPARAAFAKAAAAACDAGIRPDAAAFTALAGSFEWIDAAWHDPLRPPPREAPEPCIGLTGTGLVVPRRAHGAIAALCGEADRAQARALAAHPRGRAPARAATLDALCDWMRQVRAQLDVHAPDGRPLWHAGGADPSALRAALCEAADDAVSSLAADWAVVHERSVAFLSALRDPGTLPTACALLEEGGSAYVSAARRTIVVPLKASTFDPLRVPAPPYHRLLLGARVMHEWGHLAHQAGHVRVPEALRPRYRAARQQLGEAFAEVLAAVPAPFAEAAAAELAELSPDRAQTAAALARKTLSRIGDYLANLLSARLIPAAEMQAYVRANVRHHLDEELGLVAELARFAHEVHYLPLAGLPRAYVYETARVRQDFIACGVVGEAALEQLFDAVGEVFACYSIDEAALRLGTAPRAANEDSPRREEPAAAWHR